MRTRSTSAPPRPADDGALPPPKHRRAKLLHEQPPVVPPEPDAAGRGRTVQALVLPPASAQPSRPGQAAPVQTAAQKQKGWEASRDSRSQPSDVDSPQQSPGRDGGPTATTSAKAEAKETNWGFFRSMRTQHLLRSLVSDRQRRQQQAAAWVTAVGERVRSARMDPCPCARPCEPCGTWEQQETLSVAVLGLEFTGPVAVPLFSCSKCKRRQTLDAVLCGCFASAPVQPGIWYDAAVMQWYQDLAPRGLSGTGVCGYWRTRSVCAVDCMPG